MPGSPRTALAGRGGRPGMAVPGGDTAPPRGPPGPDHPTFRPDLVTDPERQGWAADLDRLAELTGEDTGPYTGYLAALARRREASGEPGRPPPTTATPPPVPPTSIRPTRPGCTTGWAGRREDGRTLQMPSRSAPRCSPSPRGCRWTTGW